MLNGVIWAKNHIKSKEKIVSLFTTFGFTVFRFYPSTYNRNIRQVTEDFLNCCTVKREYDVTVNGQHK